MVGRGMNFNGLSHDKALALEFKFCKAICALWIPAGMTENTNMWTTMNTNTLATVNLGALFAKAQSTSQYWVVLF